MDERRPREDRVGDGIAAEYRAAHDACIVVRRTDRAVLRVTGRDPVRMVNGLLTNDVAALVEGQTVPAALLTPRGRMLAEVRVIRRTADVLLETDAGAYANLLATFRKFVAPLFAKAEDASASFAVLGVYGPTAVTTVAAALAAPATEPATIRIETGYAGVPGIDLVLHAAAVDASVQALVDAGATSASLETLDLLRIEAGRPRWGAELDESVIPLEAGLKDDFISTGKGCYTGQEVIVRILHRGHVNRHLRGMVLGDAVAPARGAKLFRAGEPKPMGEVTSACHSPRMGATIALGYIRREIEPGSFLRLGEPDGPSARIVALPFETIGDQEA